MLNILLVALGGALGAAARHGVSSLGRRLCGDAFPLGTLAVNAVGCLLIGLLGAAFAGPWAGREPHRLFLIVGFLGGLTTFSAFGWETLRLAQDGHAARAAVNVLLNNVLGLGAAWAGFIIGAQVLRR